MRKPTIEFKECVERRKRLRSQLPEGSAMILCSPSKKIKSKDTSYFFRPDSNVYYLSGFDEPDAIFVFRPGQTPETIFFVHPKDRLRETWDGFRYGIEGVETQFGIDKGYCLNDVMEKLPELLKDCTRVYYSLFKNPEQDRVIGQVIQKAVWNQERSGKSLLPIFDSNEILDEMRLFKSAYEIRMLEQACAISEEAFVEAMKFVRPGVTEHQVHSLMLHQMMMKGAKSDAYNLIAASGNNATTLHYEFNEDVCRDGDLILIDAGASFEYYSGDITRTFPVSGRFSNPQKAVYQSVLNVQKTIIDQIRPGVTLQALRENAIDLLTDAMLELGLFTGIKEDIIENGDFKKYYPHGIGHWLGIDVHDVGSYYTEGKSRPLEPGMVFTVEPGLYIPEDDSSAPAELRGIGVRIEDDILVTERGCKNLTSDLVKEIVDIEDVMK